MRRKRAKEKSLLFVSRARFAFVTLALTCVFAAIGVRLYYLHVVKNDWSVAITDKVRCRIDKINARRGDITDIRGNLLATSRPIIELGVDPEMIKEDPETNAKLAKIAQIIKMDFPTLKRKCKASPEGTENPVRWRKLADAIDDNTYASILSLKVKGIYGNRKYVREYPSGALLSHAVGFVNKEFKAECGAERLFDYYLRGQDGWRETERDGKRRELAHFRTREVPATDGLNVELSIDIILQGMAQREMKRIVEKFDPKSATIIISEPATGYILALANYPNFDPNNYNKYPVENLRNIAISDQYEPGSTFKIVSIAAALNESLVGPEDRFDCETNTIMYKGRILRLPKEAHKMGVLSVREITKKSSNKGVAHLATMLGENKLYSYAKAFGYGEKTDIGLSGEIPGTLHEPKDWDGLTITRMPMGHAVAATPMQVHCAMSVIANQGIYMQPQIIHRVFDASGQTKINFPSKAIRRVISPKVAALMSDMLAEVVSDEGTARRAAVEGFKVAGKTGTSQKIINGTYSTRQHIASFSGFFPAQRPRLVITVVVDTPRGSGIGYGGIVAAPSFSSIARQAANYMGIKNDEEFEKMVAWKGIVQ